MGEEEEEEKEPGEEEGEEVGQEEVEEVGKDEEDEEDVEKISASLPTHHSEPTPDPQVRVSRKLAGVSSSSTSWCNVAG